MVLLLCLLLSICVSPFPRFIAIVTAVVTVSVSSFHVVIVIDTGVALAVVTACVRALAHVTF